MLERGRQEFISVYAVSIATECLWAIVRIIIYYLYLKHGY